MKIYCQHIDRAVQIAANSDNSIQEISTGWSKVKQVVHMSRPLTADVLREIQTKVPSLRYWSSERTPHNRAEDGFICDEDEVGLSFPKR
ncbi:conserved hypothetical protein [Paraburkholderia ribeironis]|uniref:Uncharacterized protein n=1 Tax=Paraburkholderia ribeironis TaxID=1247936 RepID=A0A1N7RL82_9BURK|nr:conserved hypothetical protein [Paraburkholderia ribeironis]